MRHFDQVLFNEILRGLRSVCKGANIQTLLSAATEIYLRSSEEPTKEGEWIEEKAPDARVKALKIVECPFCRTRRAVFVADKTDYCSGCGARLKYTCLK